MISHAYKSVRTRRRCVTLLELVLAVSLLVVLSAMTYWFYTSMLRTREVGIAEAYKLRLVRAVMDRLATEIRQASMATVDARVGIRGEAERIWLSTYRLPSRAMSKVRDPSEPPPPGEYDVTKVEYSIARHPEILDKEGGWEMPLGLARNELLIPRPGSLGSGDLTDPDRQTFGDDQANGQDIGQPDSAQTDAAQKDAAQQDAAEQDFLRQMQEEEAGKQGSRIGRDAQIQWDELYAPEIRHLRFCYYDGKKWWDTWDVQGENPLPQMVMVTIGFEPHAPLDGTRGRDKDNEEFCECLDREPPDCAPLPPDQYSRVVRVAEADPLFRSRVTRESQSLIEQVTKPKDDAAAQDGGTTP